MPRLLTLAFLSLAVALPLAAQDPTRTISVSGESDVRVVPDEAVVRLGIEVADPVLEVATQRSEAVLDAITAAARSAGAAPEHIRTDRIDLRPSYERRRRDDGSSETYIDRYQAARTILVTLRDLDALDDFLRGAVAAGANRIDGVEFRSTDLRAHRDRARLLAVDAAREKAAALAARLGQTLAEPLSITESGVASPSGRFSTLFSQNVVSEPAVAVGTSESVSPGQISIRARIAVVFALAD